MSNRADRKKLVVVADDFTGATDAGVQFRKAGFSVSVIIDRDRLEAGFESFDVVVIDLESRFDPPATAYSKCLELGRRLYDAGHTLVYKKMDSTLRGNIGAEIDGLMAGLQVSVSVFAPALPVYRRITENGVAYVHGVKLEDTEFALDPRTPVRHSRIADILSLQTSRRSSEITFPVFSETAAALDELIARSIEQGTEILVFDSRNESELEQVAQAIGRMHPLPMLIVGSAGLALHLHGFPSIQKRRLAFVFSGSVSEKSREQVQQTAGEGGCRLFFLDGKELIWGGDHHEEIIDAVEACIDQGHCRFIFTSALSRQDVESVFEVAAGNGVSRDEASERIAIGIGKLAAKLISKFHPSGVLLTGGDTAIKTVKALGATGMTVEGEILPGIQWGTLTGAAVNTIIATKSGGFGAQDAISKTLEFFGV